MSARDVVRDGIIKETGVSLATVRADAAIAALTAAGYRILAPGEVGTEARPFGFFFDAGDRVTKIKGSSWTGRVVGFYSTTLTPRGYCIESENEPGSVQLYPEAAMTKLTEAPGGLHWCPVRVWRPVRFTHDANGFLLRHQETDHRWSRWFEKVLRCDECAWPFKPAFRPAGRAALNESAPDRGAPK